MYYTIRDAIIHVRISALSLAIFALDVFDDLASRSGAWADRLAYRLDQKRYRLDDDLTG